MSSEKESLEHITVTDDPVTPTLVAIPEINDDSCLEPDCYKPITTFNQLLSYGEPGCLVYSRARPHQTRSMSTNFCNDFRVTNTGLRIPKSKCPKLIVCHDFQGGYGDDRLLDYMDSNRDARVDNWLFMSSPFPTLLICVSYVLTVKYFGPKFMENRKPYELRTLLVLYNAFQVIFSAWLFYEYGRGGWFHGYSFTCQPVDYSQSEMAIRMAHACWWYYFSKYTEFFDTFFFVLRKKKNQITSLHVIHHGLMPLSVWFGVKYTPGGHSTFFGLLNTLVHVFMYFYYMVSAMGPQWQKYIWWKKHITTMQMVQFVLIAGHAFQLLFTSCDYPRGFVWWIGSHGLLFLVLFSNFYRKSYNSQVKGRLAEAASFSFGICSPTGSMTTMTLKKEKIEDENEGHFWGRGIESAGRERDDDKGH